MINSFLIRGEHEFDEQSNLEILDCPLLIINNVISVNFIRPDSWNISKRDEEIKTDIIYFLIDLDLDTESFGHWVYEVALFIPIYLKVCEKYSNKKIVLWQYCKKQYRNLFYQHFKIDISNIYTGCFPSGNTLIIHPPITSLHLLTPPSQLYIHLITNFKKFFKSSLNIEVKDTFLLMPRQTKENYIHNDRKYDWSKLEKLMKILEKTPFQTDDVTSLQDQIDEVNGSKIIILSDGSPLTVNGGLFCLNKKIYVVGDNITLKQASTYNRVQMLLNFVKENNELFYVNEDEMIKQLELNSIQFNI